MGWSTLGAQWNDTILDELTSQWASHRGITNPRDDVHNALLATRNAIEFQLSQVVIVGEVIKYATHHNVGSRLLIVSIEFQDHSWRGAFDCDDIVVSGIIETDQEMHIDVNKPGPLPPPPTSSAPVVPKTMNIPVDPVADYDRAMRGVG